MKASSDGDDGDDDDDFDEVPEKEGYEPHIPEHLRAEYGKFMFRMTDMFVNHIHSQWFLNLSFLRKKINTLTLLL